eukprot:SAG25_NODE_881_length_4969_cov_53.695072_5_plen_105_part_00
MRREVAIRDGGGAVGRARLLRWLENAAQQPELLRPKVDVHAVGGAGLRAVVERPVGLAVRQVALQLVDLQNPNNIDMCASRATRVTSESSDDHIRDRHPSAPPV